MSLSKQIEACRGLAKNWNSYGADPVSDAVVDFALEVADQLSIPSLTMACPTNDGGIELSDEDTSKWIKIWVDDEHDVERPAPPIAHGEGEVTQ